MIERLASADFNMSQDAVRRRCYRARKEREAEASLTARQASVCVYGLFESRSHESNPRSVSVFPSNAPNLTNLFVTSIYIPKSGPFIL